MFRYFSRVSFVGGVYTYESPNSGEILECRSPLYQRPSLARKWGLRYHRPSLQFVK